MMFPDWYTPLAGAANGLIDQMIVLYGDRAEQASNTFLKVLVWTEQWLRNLPPWVMIAASAALAAALSKKWSLGVMVAAGLWVIGALGQWDAAMQSLALMFCAILCCLVCGLPLGIACANLPRVRAVVVPLLDLMQTIPIFVYLLPIAMLLGLGKVPALLATVVYAIAPVIRLTDLGIRQVDSAALEAAKSFGATAWQRLVKVQLPLAGPTILQGINQTTLLALSMVVIASMIGARGVGETVLLGLQRNDLGMGLVGGIVICILAILLDRTMQGAGVRWQTRSVWQGRLSKQLSPPPSPPPSPPLSTPLRTF
jgi:glycine betaine/proline transport system permease protein